MKITKSIADVIYALAVDRCVNQSTKDCACFVEWLPGTNRIEITPVNGSTFYHTEVLHDIDCAFGTSSYISVENGKPVATIFWN